VRWVDRFELLSCDEGDDATCAVTLAAGCSSNVTELSAVASSNTGATAASDARCPDVSVEDKTTFDVGCGGKLTLETGFELVVVDLRSAGWYEMHVCTFTNYGHIHLYITAVNND